MTRADLPAMEVASRCSRLVEQLTDVDALLVTHLPNIRYLTGFTGSAAIVLVRANGITFVTDGRYGEQAAEQLDAAHVDATIHVGATSSAQRDRLQAAAADVKPPRGRGATHQLGPTTRPRRDVVRRL